MNSEAGSCWLKTAGEAKGTGSWTRDESNGEAIWQAGTIGGTGLLGGGAISKGSWTGDRA